MKKSLGLSSAVTVVIASLLGGNVFACDGISVTTINGAPGPVTVGLMLDSTPASSSGFTVSNSTPVTQTLPVGAMSGSTLHLAAQLSMGTTMGNCSATVANTNIPGMCTYDMTISYVAGSDPVDSECKHDNGNHWGEYKQLGLTVPPHSGKPNAPCKPGKKNSGGTTGTGSTPASISCQLISTTATTF